MAEAETTIVLPEPPVTLERGAMQVTVSGEGPDVVLIPGLASPADVWDATVRQLDADRRVHVVGVRGFGGLEASDSPAPVVPALVAELAAYMEGMRGVTVVGHSLGGVVALQLARDVPAVSRAVVVDALPFYPVLFDPDATVESAAPGAQAMLSRMAGVDVEQFRAMQRQGAAIYAKSPEDVARIGDWGAASDRPTVISATGTLMATDLRPDLASITKPVRILFAHDPAMGRAVEDYSALWEAQYADLPDGELTRIDGSYHFIMFDQPEAFAAALSDALEN